MPSNIFDLATSFCSSKLYLDNSGYLSTHHSPPSHMHAAHVCMHTGTFSNYCSVILKFAGKKQHSTMMTDAATLIRIVLV